MYNWPCITNKIAQKSGKQLDPQSVQAVSGGDINAAFFVGKRLDSLFVKVNTKARLGMFQAEELGLRSLEKTRSIRVPSVYCTGSCGEHAFIAMQRLNIALPPASRTGRSHRQFGHKLAIMHQHTRAKYGADSDNTIGATPQINEWSEDWYDFWRKQRLYYQLNLIQKTGTVPASLLDEGYELGEKMPLLFTDMPVASCLHGDLWQGNWAFDDHGDALIFDPAHYFGDRETDIAMTRLFGAAHPDFYAAYNEAYPLSDNYTIRETFYNIYHILNHYNLFGGSYLNQAQQMIRRVLSEIR